MSARKRTVTELQGKARILARRRSSLLFAFVMVLVYALDFGTKQWLRASRSPSDPPLELLPFLDIRHVHNTGVAFGLLSGQAGLVVMGVGIVCGLLLAVALWVPPADTWTILGMALIAGGAIGNLVDRIRLGHVTDFIHVPHWPTFNVADMAIVGGVIGLLLQTLVHERRARSADRS